jgi:hypothetical protein
VFINLEEVDRKEKETREDLAAVDVGVIFLLLWLLKPA